MRFPFLLSLALLPAALFAHAAPGIQANYSQRLTADGPSIEQLLSGFQPQQALAKAEALLPADKPVFDRTDLNAGRAASLQFSDLVRTYRLAGRAAFAAGAWEKGLAYYRTAQVVAQENVDQTLQLAAPILETWKAPMAGARKALEEGAARFKELSGKPDLTAEEARDLKNFQIHRQNLDNGEKVVAFLQKDLYATRTELDALAPMIESADLAIRDQAARIQAGTRSRRFRGDRQKYLRSMLRDPVVAGPRPAKGEKLNFLFRLRVLADGTPLANQVTAVIDRIRLDQDPFPTKKKKTQKG